MNWFNRMLVLALILCLSRTPMPWGHSHNGMDVEQLAVHLREYHPAAGENELPKGWHWHVTRIGLNAPGEAGQYPIAIHQERLGESLIVPRPDATTLNVTAQPSSSRASVSTDIVPAHAVRQQQTHLRLNVLLI